MSFRQGGSTGGPPPPTDPNLRAREARIEAIQSALRKLAHSFNNQLTPLLGYAGMLSSVIPREGDAGLYLGKIEDAGQRVREGIESILLAVKPGRRFHRRRFDFAKLVSDFSLAPPPSLIGAKIECKVPSDPIEVESDPGHWGKTLEHLVANAWEAQQKQGSVVIEARVATLDSGRARNLGILETEVLELSVSDRGPGMEKHDLEHCCDAFYTTKPPGAHQGLGLTVAHAVARQSGGQLLVENLVPKGCKVTVVIPKASPAEPSEPAPSAGAPQPAKATTISPTGETILVVDDDPGVLEILRDGLRLAGHKVETASDGAEAWGMFQADPGRYKLVVTDLTMPNMDGVELLHKVRSTSRGLPVLVVSGDAEHSGRIDFSRLDQNPPEFVPKPFSIADLRSKVETMLGRQATP